MIDLENPLENDFRVVSELTCYGERDEFRPDITILINGIPLAFVEVKKPNNQEGIQKESVSLKTNQNYSSSTEIVRKQIPSFLLLTSLVQLELFNKNSFEVFFVKKNFLNLFLNTSRIIFPFHYFW